MTSTVNASAPRWCGFNFQWMFRRDHAAPLAVPADERALDALAAWGFNFVRIPADYRFWASPVTYEVEDHSPLDLIDGYIDACRQRGLHLSLNLHRVPGYCINGAGQERRNLWTDEVAQDALCAMWRAFANRYRHIPPDVLSFDLINELPWLGQNGFSRDVHQRIIRRLAAEIREVTPERLIVIDGIDGGHTPIPELADVADVQSGRGYAPTGVSHFGSDWWDTASGLVADAAVRQSLDKARDEWWAQSTHGRGPAYPGRFAGKLWDKEVLRQHYSQWEAVERGGSAVHIGEMGCYRRVPNETALRWMSDTLEIFAEHRWGWALWNFDGPFGIVNSGRPDTPTSLRHGFQVDAALLDLMLEHRAR